MNKASVGVRRATSPYLLSRERLKAMDHALGHLMRMKRISLDMSQKFVASSIGLSFQQLQKYELGENRISASRLLQLCLVLRLNPGDVLEIVRRGELVDHTQFESEPLHTASSPSQLVLDRATVALTKAFAAIRGTARRDALLQVAEAMADTPPSAEGDAGKEPQCQPLLSSPRTLSIT